MDTNQFFTSLLGLTKPRKVEKVETDFEKNNVHVYVEYDSQEWIDTKSGEVLNVYDRREERQWHHLDTLQYQAIILYRIPRIKFHDGKIASCPVPWAMQANDNVIFLKVKSFEYYKRPTIGVKAGNY